MIEKILLRYLSDALYVPAYMEEPEKPPKRYLVLEKTGGGMDNHIYSATFIIQSYGASLLEAAELNEQVKVAMLYGDAPNAICRVELNSDYNFTDPETKRYRYQAVFDIKHY